MFSSNRQSRRYLRPWLFAAALVLLLTSIVEAGHVHGVFTPASDHCVLCEHTAAMDKVPLVASAIVILQLTLILVTTGPEIFTPRTQRRFATIRAPPFLLP